MLDALTGLFDPTGFPARKDCGTGWTPSLIWLHVSSDLLIWLAYVSIPLILLYFTRRRDLPFPRLFVLFALFILACGTTHLIDALIFQYPVYRFAGLMKAVTAVVSWATVIALVPIVPRVMFAVAEASKRGADTKLHRPLPERRVGRTRDYIVAVLAAVLAILVRAAVDPLLVGDHVFVVALLAVVYVSWQYGFGPGVVCLVVGVSGYAYMFVAPRYGEAGPNLGTQMAIALFFFCGIACAALGESQRTAHRRARTALTTAVARQEELESEVVRRRVVETALRQRETELVAAQTETAEALARLNAFLDNAPVGIAFFDPDLRYVRINTFLAEANGKPIEEHTGRRLTEVLPDFPPDVLAAYRRAAGPNGVPFTTQFRRSDRRSDRRATGGTRAWHVTVFPVRNADGGNMGAGVVAQDVTDRLKAEEELQRSERNLADFFENANVGLHWVGPDGIIIRVNKAELELLGFAREEYVGRPVADFHDDADAICDILTRLKRGEHLDNYPARLRCKDGTTRDVLISSSALWEDGRFVHSRCFTRDVTEVKRAADELAERARASSLRADVAAALASGEETPVALQACAETLVRQIGAAFARVWTVDPSGQWLQLQASAGMYTHTDGPHGRVAVGQFKIGRIAESRTPHLTNDVQHDPNVSDPEWAAREGMVSFAGYPLVVEGRVLGVLALFARHKLSDSLVADLGPVAASVAQYIDRRRVVDAVRESEERFRSMADSAPAMVWLSELGGRRTYFNKTWLEFTGRTTEQDAGYGWADNIHPDDRPVYLAAYATAITDRRPFELEYRLRRRDGADRWVVARGTPRFTPSGAFAGFVGLCLDVTDRREAMEAVRMSEERYRVLTEAVPHVVWNANAEGEVTYFNRRWLEYTALPLSRAFGHGWLDALHPEDRDRVLAAWRATVSNAVAGGADRFSHELRLRDVRTGGYRWFLSVAVPLRLSDGRVDQWIGSMADIHDQKTAAEAIRESDAFRRSVFENSPDCLKIIDLDGRVLEMNEGGCRLMEVDDFPAIRGSSWADLWPVANRETIRDAVAAAGAGQVGRFQGFCPTAKGTPKYWDVSVAGVPGADGRPFRLIGVSRDVTEERRAADAVRASEQRFRTLTEAVPQMVWTADPQGEVTFFNRRWEEYTGTPPDVARTRGWETTLIHPEDTDRLRARWQLAVAGQAAGFTEEFRLRRASDGVHRWMLSVAVPLRDATGSVAEWVGTLTDIEDQKQRANTLAQMVRRRTAELEDANASLVREVAERTAAEARVRAVAAELERSNDELEKFAYVASHDLQEPLRKIQAFGDRLKTKCREALPDTGKEYVDRMLVAAGRMRRLIDDLLTFSRVTTHRRPFVRVDLAKLVREVVSDLEVRIAQTNGTVVIGALPQLDADFTQMRQLFQNLIANAVKFHRTGVPPVVEVVGELVSQPPSDPDAGEPGPVCRIRVRDNGIGFDEKYRDRIFDVFQRLHGRDEYEGTGVGLAICRKIVERHGGTITAHSREGEGATFVVELPARQSDTRETTDDDTVTGQADHHLDGRRRPG